MKQEVYMSRVKVLVAAAAFVFAVSALASVPTTLNDFFLPGSQPGQSGQLETPDKCDNCHGGYNHAVEPAFNWRGSMMSQAARDPFFYACLAISNQNAPDAGDLCIRCHSPAGWLEGRSIPTDGSALNLNDRQGVQCDFCHKLVKPTPLGVNPYPNDPAYTSGTYPQDQSYLATINPIPAHSANGMYVADASNAKRGPFTDAEARHQFIYSPFHRDASLCGTCHDVSNPVYYKDATGSYLPNSFGAQATDFDPYTMFPIERTFSEWKMSAYNTPNGIYAPQFGGNKAYVSLCQDCHMKDVTGIGCNKAGAPIRNDLPLHDMTGGNTFIPKLLSALWPGEIDPAAVDAGVNRAMGMLETAATMTLVVTPQGADYLAKVEVTNETGHKLPSGYPEGRRIWINLKAYDTLGVLIYESGAYEPVTAVLTNDVNANIYEIKPGISADLAPVLGYPAGPSFHFVLNNYIYKDNRIPPRGFTNANFEMIQSPPVGYIYADGQFWDETDYVVPGSTARVVATLYYQTISKEYVEFLRDENRTNGWGQTFYDLWVANGKSAPVMMNSQTYDIQIIVDNQVPTAPSNLTATTASSSQINLSWTASTDNIGVAGYYVYRNGVQVAITSATSYSDMGLNSSTTYSYYVTAYDAAGNVSLASNTATATTSAPGGKRGKTIPPNIAWLELSGPNPFNAVTQLSYYLPEAGMVSLEVFNVYGRKVTTLVDGWQPAGEHRVNWSAENIASGVYFVELKTSQGKVAQKVTLLK